MKKIRVLLVVLCCFLITACKDKKDPTPVDPDQTGNQLNEKVNFKEKVIVDQNNVKITAKSLDYTDGDVKIKLLIENNTKEHIIISARNFSINGIMFDPLVSIEVDAGDKINSEMTVFAEEMIYTKITSIKEVDFALRVINNAFEEILYQKDIKLETDALAYVQEYDNSGKVIVDQNNVKISLIDEPNDKAILGSTLVAFIENNSKEDILIESVDVKVNGYDIQYGLSAEVAAGMKAYKIVIPFEEELIDTGENDIKDIELKINVSNLETEASIFKTKTIKASFK